jgi:CBS domain-containing protein
MLVVRDIMEKDLVTVNAGDSARDLAQLLADEEISGAPVLDGGGELVGVVSATDLVRLAAEESRSGVDRPPLRPGADPVDEERQEEEDWESEDLYGFFRPEASPFARGGILDQLPQAGLDAASVGDIMTPVSFTVTPDLPLNELCDLLVRERIHRAIVLEGGELAGIVTTLDVLRAVADGRLG